ncbi:Leucine zipper transcription factor-like protein 1 [Irineochytrium annulatum]|nr:Leucine zipper transcription factor-like protein 1 [Irineochytrium annulatum]
MQSPAHRQEYVGYLNLIRSQRHQSIRELKCVVREIRDRRLCEDTYNNDDVGAILAECEQSLAGTFECEMMHQSHLNVLLMQQYFVQADAKGMRLEGNMGKLEDRALLEAAKRFEEDVFAGKAAQEPTPAQSNEELVDKNDESAEKIADQARRIKQLEQQVQLLKQEAADNLRKEELKNLRARLSTLESDLNVRLDRSTPVQELRRMMKVKNDRVREYRDRLAKYEPEVLGEKDAE